MSDTVREPYRDEGEGPSSRLLAPEEEEEDYLRESSFERRLAVPQGAPAVGPGATASLDRDDNGCSCTVQTLWCLF